MVSGGQTSLSRWMRLVKIKSMDRLGLLLLSEGGIQRKGLLHCLLLMFNADLMHF